METPLLLSQYHVKIDEKAKYLFIVLIAMLVFLNATSQVTANFTTINSTDGCGSLLVEFKDLSIGNPTSWLWDFGNGNTSTLKNPDAIYATPGFYDVVLTVSDGNSNDTKTLISFIKVYEDPILELEAPLILSGCIPFYTNFESIIITNTPIISWQWNFGDGGTSNVQNPAYIYNNEGLYSVSLSVVDINGCENLITAFDLIEVNQVPIANFTTDINFSCDSSELITFSNNSSYATEYIWEFGDGTTSNQFDPSHIFSSGIFSVSLYAKEGNCLDTMHLDNFIQVGAVLSPDFSVNTNSICEGSNVNFLDITTNSPNTFLWDFGDGNTSILQNPTHTYNVSGNYDITLTTSISGECIKSIVFPQAIEVFENPIVSFSADTTYSCTTPFVVNFTDNTVDAVDWLWDFGNGQSSTASNSIQQFNNFDLYDVSLTIENSKGCVSTKTNLNYIKVEKIIVSISTLANEGCAPLSSSFLDVSSSSIPTVHWDWNFGNGLTSTLQNPTHIYNYPGSYDVSLLLINEYGCFTFATFPNYIIVDPIPIVDFVADPVISCAGEDIIFTDLSSLGTNNWQWSFGDGFYSNIQNPTHQYINNGIYEISLIAGINSCKDTIIFSDYIKIIEPIAIFEETYNCDNPRTVNFLNTSIGANSVLWDFGDGTTSTLINPDHTFLNLGVYNVSLTVTNNITGCSHILLKQIELAEPIAEFNYLINSSNNYQDSIGCVPKHVSIDNQSQYFDYYEVLWSDGYIGIESSEHTFTTPGSFDVTLIVTDIHDCKDTMKINNMYNIYDINVDFEISNIIGCDSLLVNFIDLSIPSLSNLEWDFGDGLGATTNNVQHIYYNEGVYDITVYAESTQGCKDTLKKEEYVKFQYPVANLSSNTQAICPEDSVEFSNLSSGVGLVSNWDFGDGTSSSAWDPSHKFPTNGSYTINLTVTDSFGCSDYLTLNNYILVQKPSADFSSSTLSSLCPPLISDFINSSSSDASIFIWNFGDGNYSSLENPSHLFSNSGIFDISLMVENSLGCRDSLIRSSYINILGPSGSFSVSDTLICKNDSIKLLPSVINTDYYFWDFGNGVISTDSIIYAIYDNAGSFIPSLIIQNNSGCELTILSDDTINVNEIIIDAGIDVELCEGESVELNATGEGYIYNWIPNIGLSYSNISNPIANPTTSMFYYVNHTDGFCSAIDSVFVYVHNNVPNASFVVNNLCEGDSTSFIGSSGLFTNNNNYIWSFGENGQLVNSVLNIGNNLVSLIVENLDNTCKDTSIQEVEIITAPIADFLVKESEKCFGEPFVFINNSSSNTNSFLYDFGDNIGISTSDSPSYNYLMPGLFQITLHITSNLGCKDSIIKSVIVHDIPSVDFLIKNHCEGEGNVFIDLSSVSGSKINLVEYNFPDGSISTDSISTHIFEGYGLFNVILNATSNEGCKSSIVKTTEVFANPVVNFYSHQFCEKEPTVFNDSSSVPNSNMISYNWNFGSEAISNDKDPTYTFSSSGIFDVTLTALSHKGCYGFSKKKIKIYRSPYADFKVSSDICLGDDYKIIDISECDDDIIDFWKYTFGDGTFSINQHPTHNYNNIGEYDIKLEVVSSQGCKSDTTKISAVRVHPFPIAKFQPNKIFASEILSEIEFFNYSKGATSFLWDFDNGDYSFEENPKYTFNNVQLYNVILTVTNDFGCRSSVIKTINIHPEYTVFIPDAFSPNGDGLNDIFEVKGKGIFSFEMQIYDRWGGVIFRSEDINLGWDGTNYIGEPINNGVFIYHILIYDHNKKLWTYSGEVNLKK